MLIPPKGNPIMSFDEFDELLDQDARFGLPGEDDAEKPLVIVIDDDESVREALRFALRDYYRVQSYKNGTEGIHHIDASAHALILDIKMKGKDGFETFQDIRKKLPYLPIIFYSAYQDIKDPYQVMNEYRPFGYITKGEPVRKLLDLVKLALRYYKQILRIQQELIEKHARLAESERRSALEELAGMVASELSNSLTSISVPAARIHDLPPLDVNKIWECWESDEEGVTLQQYLNEWQRNWDIVQDGVELIQVSEERARQFLNDLQGFIGSRSHQWGLVDICNVLEEVLRLQKQRLKSVRVITECDGDEIEIISSRGQLGQIFTNLISNACDAMSGQEYPQLHITMVRKNEGVEVAVKDNGIGIAPDQLPHIFKPFYSTKGVRATGLGLSIVERIIKAHKGTIAVESQLGKGTTITFWLPREIPMENVQIISAVE